MTPDRRSAFSSKPSMKNVTLLRRLKVRLPRWKEWMVRSFWQMARQPTVLLKLHGNIPSGSSV
jgi:hypothetical protein